MKTHSPIHRVLHGVFAHGYAQAVTVVVQLLSLPIFLSRWEVETYGLWLMLSAIPMYLSFADVGILTYVGNAMTMNIARGENDLLVKNYSIALKFVTQALPALALISGIILTILSGWFDSNTLVCIFLLGIVSIVSSGCGLFDAVYRAYGKYPKVTILLTTARVFDFIGAIIGLYAYGTVVSVSAGMASGRILSVLIMIIFMRYDIPKISHNCCTASWGDIISHIRRGGSFLAFPLGTALNLQGSTLIIGTIYGATTVAFFNSARTLSRIVMQVSLLASRSLAPEYSRLHGQNNFSEATKLFRTVRGNVFVISISAVIVLQLFGSEIYNTWTGGQIKIQEIPFAILLLTAVVGALWQIEAVPLTSINKQNIIAFGIVISSTSGLTVLYLLGSSFALEGSILVLLSIELVVLFITKWSQSRYVA